MGCKNSITFIPNDDNNLHPGQGTAALRMMTTLGFDKHAIDLLYTLFHDLDVMDNGEVPAANICAYFNTERHGFELRVFTAFDERHSGDLDFSEMVLGLWHVLTLEPGEPTSKFIFSLYSKKRTAINIDEMKKLLQNFFRSDSMHLEQYTAEIKQIMGKELEMRLDKFMEWIDGHPLLLVVLNAFQHVIANQLLGYGYWQKLNLERHKHPEQNQVDWVHTLSVMVHGKKGEHKEKEKEQTKDGNAREKVRPVEGSSRRVVKPNLLHKDDDGTKSIQKVGGRNGGMRTLIQLLL